MNSTPASESVDPEIYEETAVNSQLQPPPCSGRSEDSEELDVQNELKPIAQGSPAAVAKHAAGTCNPCLYFASLRGCHWQNCSFCHLKHRVVRKMRPRKLKRDFYKENLSNIWEEKVRNSDHLHKRVDFAQM